jgi:hypothetical protein
MSDENKIREAAYKKWEAEGRPDGQHERHWQEASEAHGSPSGIPQTWSADHGGGVGASRQSSNIESEGIRPEDLNSENDQGAT